MAEQQSFASHTKWVPGFHFFVMPALLLNLVWSIYRCWKASFTADSLIAVVTAAALFLLMGYARLFVLTVQDRVIRMEERLRMEKLLPEELKPRIGEFTREQLMGIRFACDSELPALARQVLTDRVADRKAIKRMVQNWRAAYLRA